LRSIARAASSNCSKLTIAGSVASTTATFTGFADPALHHDPAQPSRVWMLYSHLSGRPATNAGGTRRWRAACRHPAGAKRQRRRELGARGDRLGFAAGRDPEGLGPPSYFGSETPSLTAVADATGVTWYSVRLAYFLEPATALCAALHDQLGECGSPRREPPPGGTRRRGRFGARYLDPPSPPTRRTCASTPCRRRSRAVPSSTTRRSSPGDRVYVVAECLEFDGKAVSDARSRMVVLRTRPVGTPSGWTWEYVGVLADQALAREMGGERLTSATISRAADGALLFMSTPRTGPGGIPRQRLRRDRACIARPARRAPWRWWQLGRSARGRQQLPTPAGSTGACTHDPRSASGIVSVAATTRTDCRPSCWPPG
jgi:hypothetical protein